MRLMDSTKKIIRKVALAVFENRKLLLARSASNKDAYYTLGGKIEEGETDNECLVREVREEAQSKLDLKSLKFLKEFSGPAHGKENTIISIRLYEGKLLNKPNPSHEVAEFQYFDSTIEEKYLTAVSKQIFAWLKSNNYID